MLTTAFFGFLNDAMNEHIFFISNEMLYFINIDDKK